MDKETKNMFVDQFIDLGKNLQQTGRSAEYIRHYYEAMQKCVESGAGELPAEVHKTAAEIALKDRFTQEVKKQHPHLSDERVEEEVQKLMSRVSDMLGRDFRE